MKPIRVFILLVAIAGMIALLGSAVGGRFGRSSLFVGGFVGGIAGCCLAAWFANRMEWISKSMVRSVAVGAVLGFIVAAVIAMNFLRSPVIPLASSLLVGFGGLLGAKVGTKSDNETKG